MFVEAAQRGAPRCPRGRPDAGRQSPLRIAPLPGPRPPMPGAPYGWCSFTRVSRQRFTGQPQEAEEVATQPLGPLPAGADAVQLAAWTVVGNVLLNLYELMRP